MSDRNLAETAAQRGNNLVCYAPPSPSACRSVLTGLLGRVDPMHPGPALSLAATESIEEWGRVGAESASGARTVAAARTPARLERALKSPEPRLLITSPDVAHQLVRRAALKPAELSGILLLWPEGWGGDALATELLQEVPKETQRVVITADPEGSAGLIERYCWRAAVADLLGAAPAEAAPRVQTVPVGWGRRAEALADLIEQLDPDSLGVWIADPADAASIEATLQSTGATATVGTELPEHVAVVVAYDLPSPARLRTLGETGQVVLLVPPGTEAYVSRLAPQRKPLHLTAALAAAEAQLAADRRAIAEAVESAGPAAFHALNPLLERHEATALAAALYGLWKDARARGGAPAPAPRPSAPRLWVGFGKRDNATPNDLVAALIKHGGVSRDAIGKIEIRESYSLIDLGTGADPERTADRLAGQVIRKRRLVARLDRGTGGSTR